MIEWSRINDLREEVGNEDFEEVVSLFIEEVEEVISRLSSNPDHRTLEHDLHFLKGSALNLGFKAFSDLCYRGEGDCANGKASSVDVETIVSVYRDSVRKFRAELSSHLIA